MSSQSVKEITDGVLSTRSPFSLVTPRGGTRCTTKYWSLSGTARSYLADSRSAASRSGRRKSMYRQPSV